MIKDVARMAKEDSMKVLATGSQKRNAVLEDIAAAIEGNRSAIITENEKDMAAGEKDGLSAPLLKRLKFDEVKIRDVVLGIRDLISLDDPVGEILLKRQLDEGLILEKVTCPIGVIGVIFESRPDALVQIATLCVKSGNCVILKGGREAAHTNRILYELISGAVKDAGLPEHFVSLVENRADIDELLKCDEYIDLIIPRGSNEFVKYIMDNSNITVMGHADGVCHIYVDDEADLNKAIQVIYDSKTQYVAACNAVETLLVHEGIADDLLPQLTSRLAKGGVQVKGDDNSRRIADMAPATDDDFAREYLDLIIAVKIVSSMDEAIDHINTYGSHHTDSILTENAERAERFMSQVDSAGVYSNCSTRFADGYRYGFGAEVGISTGKLHARGPVGLDGLVTYKYKLYGDGQIVSDYAEGKKAFHFKDL